MYSGETADKSNASLEINNSIFSLGFDTSLYQMILALALCSPPRPCYPYSTGLTIFAQQIAYDLFVMIAFHIETKPHVDLTSTSLTILWYHEIHTMDVLLVTSRMTFS